MIRSQHTVWVAILLAGCGNPPQTSGPDPGGPVATREEGDSPPRDAALPAATVEEQKSATHPAAADPIASLELLGARFTRNGQVVVSLNLSNTQITDADLVHLQTLSELKHIYLFNTPISDRGLVYLKHLKELEELSLARTAITDNGLSQLAELTRLETLDLSLCRQIKGSGLKHFKSMSRLKELLLYQTQVGDASLDHLAQMTHLDYIVLPDVTVSESGLAALQKSLPDCDIIKQDY